MTGRRVAWLVAACVALLLAPVALAHGVGEGDAGFLQGNEGLALGPFLYLGAKHMVTGYDHLLFLVGVVFFLARLKDVVLYVSMFTLGHSATLLLGVLADIPADAHLIDAVIGLSVVYKGFDNLGGFRHLGFQPDAKGAVLLFGLFHGFGLATKVQELHLSRDGLVGNLLAFNVGVELGQAIALAAILVPMTYWRTRPSFVRNAFLVNVLLVAGGVMLIGHQLTGYFTE